MKQKSLFLAAALVLLLCACRHKNELIDASGTFEATEVVVSSEANGKIIEYNLHEGDKVIAGLPVGLIDTIQLSLTRKQLVASVNAVESRTQDPSKQTGQIRTQISTQKRERERVKRLLAADAANAKQLDDINAAIAMLERQLAAAEANISQGNLAVAAEITSLWTQVAQVDDQLRKCYITSPINGTILAKYAEAGELTGIGKPLFKVADIENMTLRAYITASQLTKIKLGQKVTILADYGEGGYRNYEGTITRISDKSEFTPKTIQTRDERANLVYAIKVSFINDGYVKIGMYGDIIFGNEKSE